LELNLRLNLPHIADLDNRIKINIPGIQSLVGPDLG
jgi:hypothetical protein